MGTRPQCENRCAYDELKTAVHDICTRRRHGGGCSGVDADSIRTSGASLPSEVRARHRRREIAHGLIVVVRIEVLLNLFAQRT